MNSPAESLPQKIRSKDTGHSFQCHVRLRAFPDQSKNIEIQAGNQDDAVQKLMADGYVVISVKKKGETSDSSHAFLQTLARNFSTQPKGSSPGKSFSFFQKVWIFVL